jgi:holo-[acyl-carrier protein] synthase
VIFGVGVDIVQIDRMERGLERHGERFYRRILTDAEQAEFLGLQQKPRFLASRFAAKEAFVKALGTGFQLGLTHRDAGVEHDELGRPVLTFSPRALELMRERGVGQGHLSLSDEIHYAVAFVTLEKE